MPYYKLHYFNVRGRAESSRILLALAGADWEDVRMENSEFPAAKKSGIYPFGQVPALEVDGKFVGQSMAILRYLAKEFGFVPPTNLQIAIADSLIDQMQDCLVTVIKAYLEKDPAKKEEIEKDLKENVIPTNMKYFDKILKENNGGKIFFFGEKITYADVHFFAFWNGLNEGSLDVPEFLTKEFPDLAKVYEGVKNEPGIAAYLKKRPLTSA